jgi:hypothetical protein
VNIPFNAIFAAGLLLIAPSLAHAEEVMGGGGLTRAEYRHAVSQLYDVHPCDIPLVPVAQRRWNELEQRQEKLEAEAKASMLRLDWEAAMERETRQFPESAYACPPPEDNYDPEFLMDHSQSALSEYVAVLDRVEQLHQHILPAKLPSPPAVLHNEVKARGAFRHSIEEMENTLNPPCSQSWAGRLSARGNAFTKAYIAQKEQWKKTILSHDLDIALRDHLYYIDGIRHNLDCANPDRPMNAEQIAAQAAEIDGLEKTLSMVKKDAADLLAKLTVAS